MTPLNWSWVTWTKLAPIQCCYPPLDLSSGNTCTAENQSECLWSTETRDTYRYNNDKLARKFRGKKKKIEDTICREHVSFVRMYIHEI